jgi:hypothetical protein
MHAGNFDGDSVELDALPASQLRDLVRGVIEQHISPASLEILRAAEDSERELIRNLADRASYYTDTGGGE